jgi:GntR family transcriptional regulator/MocR family aminotransferase
LEKSGADVIHISPSHHFPTGLVTPVSRRYELLSWAARSDRHYIIEDEYDSEFRLQGRPIPTLESIDVLEKVIYINTFSKSLASTIRISYMVLPKHLMEIYNSQLGFYACTVSNFEQYTLARFITGGYLEKHINRMRNYYRGQRDKLLECIKQYTNNKNILVREENAGLHFLLEVDTNYSDQQLIENAAQNGIHISCLSQYYKNLEKAKRHTFIINYSGISPDNIEEAIKRLVDSI